MDTCFKVVPAKKQQSEDTVIAYIKKQENVSINTALPRRASSLAAVSGTMISQWNLTKNWLERSKQSQLFEMWIYIHHY